MFFGYDVHILVSMGRLFGCCQVVLALPKAWGVGTYLTKIQKPTVAGIRWVSWLVKTFSFHFLFFIFLWCVSLVGFMVRFFLWWVSWLVSFFDGFQGQFHGQFLSLVGFFIFLSFLVDKIGTKHNILSSFLDKSGTIQLVSSFHYKKCDVKDAKWSLKKKRNV